MTGIKFQRSKIENMSRIYCEGINKLPCNVLPSKFRPAYLFKVEKMFFFSTAIIRQLEGGAIYDKHPPHPTSVW